MPLPVQRHNVTPCPLQITEDEQQDKEWKQMSPLRRVWRKFRSQYNLQLMKDPLATGIALATCCTITSAVNIFVSMVRARLPAINFKTCTFYAVCMEP